MATFDAFIRFARVYDDKLLAGPPKYSGTLVHRDSLTFLPAELDIPLLATMTRTTRSAAYERLRR